jgi:hypothetical protein
MPFAANIVIYLRHRITNVTSESMNAKIQWVEYTAQGFRNKRTFIDAIYFHYGGLNLAWQANVTRCSMPFGLHNVQGRFGAPLAFFKEFALWALRHTVA